MSATSTDKSLNDDPADGGIETAAKIVLNDVTNSLNDDPADGGIETG